MSTLKIIIARRPIGEAPEWVRDAWISLSLPCAAGKPRSCWTFGVLGRPQGILGQIWGVLAGRSVRVEGYPVNAKTAVDLLAETQPAAAEWWRHNTPWFMDGKSYFIFDAAACEREKIETAQPQ
ncbi:hypothetical protein [Xanthobacter autotrophicus]|uniref:hypothetical protein n=1 Tax=Xanthobacter autotrophicus TaxID=280 RepID=UPI00372920BD